MRTLVSHIIKYTHLVSFYCLVRVIGYNIRISLGYDPIIESHFTPTSILWGIFFSIIGIPIFLRLIDIYLPSSKKEGEE